MKKILRRSFKIEWNDENVWVHSVPESLEVVILPLTLGFQRSVSNREHHEWFVKQKNPTKIWLALFVLGYQIQLRLVTFDKKITILKWQHKFSLAFRRRIRFKLTGSGLGGAPGYF